MFQRALFIFAALFISFSSLSFAELEKSSSLFSEQNPVLAEVVVEQETIQPGKPFWVGVSLSLKQKWHAYWKNPGDAGMAPVIEWQLPDGFHVKEVLWPTPEKFTFNETTGFGYENEVFFLAKILAPPKAEAVAKIGATIRWVVCDDTSCLPGNAEVFTSVPVKQQEPAISPLKHALFSKARLKLPETSQKFTATAENGRVTIKIPSSEEIAEARFFPENPERIDHAADPVLSKSDDPSGGYRMVLKEPEGAVKTDPVKGIVLLKPLHGKDNTLAYEVNLPVTAPKAADIALAYASQNTGAIDYASAENHAFKGGLFLALGLAFLGGLLLNLMPCVLPVISFKVLSFIKMSGQSRSLILKHSIFFSLGVLVSFWALAAALLAMQAYGHSVGWGFQLQEPLFVAILAAIILTFGLSMFGVFEIGSSFATLAGQAETASKQNGLKGSFFSGILATAVATPCSGPFLGTAIGFAATVPAIQAMLIFTSLAIGLSLPYLLLGAFPGLLKFMPKPGNWMVTFKEIMGFFMMATVLWLIWVFGAQTGSLAIFFLLAGFLFIAIACWILGKWAAPYKKRNTRRISFAASFLIFLLAGYAIFLASTIQISPAEEARGDAIAMVDGHLAAQKWEPFSPERIKELRKQGIPVFVDFTAKWCLVCQANHLVLTKDEVKKAFDEQGVVRMKADWTKSSPLIANELKKYGRNSVPLYLLFSGNPDEPAEILPQVLTPESIKSYLEKLS